MKRRITLITIIVAVSVVLASGGVYWYVRRNTGWRLLARAETQRRTENFDKAIALATAYIEENPSDPRGYEIRGRTYVQTRAWDDARKDLRKALDLNPNNADYYILLSNTWAGPASDVIRGRSRRLTERELRQGAIWQITGAPGADQTDASYANKVLNQALQTFQAPPEAEEQEKAKLREKRHAILTRRGYNWSVVAAGYGRLAESVLGRTKQIAAAAGNVGEVTRLEKEIEAAREEVQLARKRVIDDLLPVVQQDPTNGRAAELLVTTAQRLQREDLLTQLQGIFAQAREAGVEPAPKAVADLEVWAFRSGARTADPAQRKQALDQTIQKLQASLAQQPDNPEIKKDLAQLLASAGKVDQAERLIDQVREKSSQDPEARRFKASILLRRGKSAEAARLLQPLVAGQSIDRDAQYLYGLARARMGDDDNARQAMKQVLDTERRLFQRSVHAGANQYLVRSYMSAGLYDLALEQAMTFYRDNPTRPAALRQLVQAGLAAEGTSDALMAVNAQMRNQQAAAKDPEQKVDLRMLEVIVESLDRLNRAEPEVGRDQQLMRQARHAVELAVEVDPETPEDKLLLVKMLRILGRLTEAENQLEPLIKNNPEWAEAHRSAYEIYISSRPRLAINHLRKAVELSPQNQNYRLLLAQVVASRGQFDEAIGHIDRILEIDPTHLAASQLKANLHIARGDDLAVAEIIDSVSDIQKAGLPLARQLIAKGRFGQAIGICSDEIDKDPGSEGAYLLRAQAYLGNGQVDQAVEDLVRLVELRPKDMLAYRQLTRLLGPRKQPEQVERILTRIPGHDPYIVKLAMGRLRRMLNQPDKAFTTLNELADRADTPDWIRGQAAVEAAGALIAAGRREEGLEELHRLADLQAEWIQESRDDALLALAGLYRRAGKPDQAAKALLDLRDLAMAQGDTSRKVALLRTIAPMLMAVERSNEALEIAEHLRDEFPTEAGARRFLGNLERAGGRLDQAAKYYAEAIEMQPSFLAAYVELSRLQQGLDQPRKALETLDRLAAISEAGLVRAMFEKVQFFARRGLSEPALKSIQRLETEDVLRDPGLNLQMARAYAVRGEFGSARKCLDDIPPYAPQYPVSWEMLIDLAGQDGGVEAQITTARKALEDPRLGGNPRLVLRTMGLLAGDEQFDEALSLFEEYRKSLRDPIRQVQPALLNAAFGIMVESGKLNRAAKLVESILVVSPNRGWQFRLACLRASQDAEKAAESLVPVERSIPVEIYVAASIYSRLSQSEKIEALSQRLQQFTQRRPMPVAELLVRDLAGDLPDSAEKLTGYGDASPAVRKALEQYLQYAKDKGQQSDSLARQMLEAMSCSAAGLQPLATKTIVELIQTNPEMEIPLVLLSRIGVDAQTARKILDAVGSSDSPVVLALRPIVLVHEGKDDEAVKAFDKAAQGTGQPQYLFLKANVLERTGQLAEALKLYQEVYRATGDPQAANNAAYIITQLHSKDSQRLEEAMELVSKAVEANPRSAYLRDTLGYVHLLRGEHEKALSQLRMAVTGLPNSIEVHAHLGQAEKLAGNYEFARWHLQQAVQLAEGRQADSLSVAERASLEEARKLLRGL